MDYTINYGPFNVNPPAPRPVDMPLYAAVDGRVASLANGEALFYDPATDRNHVMTAQVLQALGLCREFQPMELHVASVVKGVPGLAGQDVAVRRVLEGLAARGLLITDDAFLMNLTRAAPIELAPPTAIFIRAFERPQQLRRLLSSLQAHVGRYGTSYRVVLVDDSRTSDAQREHADLLRQFSDASGCAVVHVDSGKWQGIVDVLSSRLGTAAGAISPLLTRDTRFGGRRGGGIGKNLITLLAAGERYLLLDDDFEFPLRRHPEFRPGIAQDARAWAVRTFDTQSEALQAGDEADDDPVAMHLSLCGQSVGAALADRSGFTLDRAGLRGLAPSLSPSLNADARIAMTINGHRGSAGASGLTWLYMLDPRGRAGISGDAARYAQLRGDPPVWFGTSRFVLAGGSHFTPFAVDNRQMLPPTSPFGRGEDSLFNALVRVADGNAQLVDAPYSIGHLQEASRDRAGLLGKPETPDVNICFSELARHVGADLYAAAPAPRLALFAARLDDLAQGSDSTVLSYLREYLSYRRSTAIEQFQKIAAADAAAPEFWAADIRSLIEVNGRAIAERGPPRFAGWAEDATSADCAAAFRREASVLADGLRAWPAAWQVAVEQGQSWLADATL